MSPRADTARLRAASNRVALLARRDLAAWFASVRSAGPDAARDGLLTVVPALVSQYGDVAATVAAEWYEEIRAADVGGSFQARLSAPTAPAAVSGTVRFAAGQLWADNAAGTLALVQAAMSRYILDRGRDTIVDNTVADRRAAGWQRFTSPTGCDFCVMLSMRGAVYKESTAMFASHDNCSCSARPSWDRDAPEVPAIAYVASQKTSNMSESAQEQHRERVAVWIQQNRDQLDEFRAAL